MPRADIATASRTTRPTTCRVVAQRAPHTKFSGTGGDRCQQSVNAEGREKDAGAAAPAGSSPRLAAHSRPKPIVERPHLEAGRRHPLRHFTA